MKHLLDTNERVEADDGYRGEDPLNAKVPASMVHVQDDQILRVRSIVRRRHETANKRIKQFDCLQEIFDHDVSLHGVFFHACVVLTQLAINNGNPLFPVFGYQDVDG